jgi:LCP family protein required for cell wall assembly
MILRMTGMLVCALLLVMGGVAAQPVVDDIMPEAAALVEVPDDVEIFLLAGFGDSNLATPSLTDMLMLLAVNRSAGSASLLHIPRDLWVNIPGFGMHKINQAYYFGETHDVEGGGLETLRQTLIYNFGIDYDHYAFLDFTGFLSLIDRVGGIRIAVDCTIQDWKLTERNADKQNPDNYEMFTLPVGVYTLDADTALWYIRSRVTSSDLDRGRRAQDVLRAVLRQMVAGGILDDLPALWDAVTRYSVMDITLADALGYVPFALSFDPDTVEEYRFRMGTHIKNALGPAPDYQAILAPDLDAVTTLVRDFLTPPTASQIALRGLRIQVVNSGGVNGLATVAADRLAQEGFQAEIITEPTHHRDFTAIYDFTGREKDSPVPTFQRLFRTTAEGVVVQPDPNRDVDYKIFVGATYFTYACTRNVIQPKWPPDEE